MPSPERECSFDVEADDLDSGRLEMAPSSVRTEMAHLMKLALPAVVTSCGAYSMTLTDQVCCARSQLAGALRIAARESAV